jgi:citrate lyase beta subunit
MRPWRSELAVPGSSTRMIEKGIASDADVVFLDLEDAVAPSGKATARRTVIDGLGNGWWGGKVRAFRVNGLDTGAFYRDLIDVVEGVEGELDVVVVPKVNRAEDVHVVATLLTQIELNLGLRRRIGIEAQIESAEGLVNCESVAQASDRLEALTFGPGDFAASAGMPAAQIGVPDAWDARYPGHRWHYAMCRIVVAARAAGLRAIDGPFTDFRDLDGLRRSAETARGLGFDGKWCIHPAQIPIVNEVFTPSADEVAWARRVIAAYEDAAASGRGAVAIAGRMIDRASVRMARRTLSSAPETVETAESREAK